MASTLPAPTLPRSFDAGGALILVGCCAVWGLNQVAMKIVNTGISPIFQAGLRSALGAVLILLWALWRRVPLTVRDGTLGPGIAIGVLFAANFLALGPGLAMTEASRGVLFYYATPFFVAVGAHYLVPGDRLTLMKCAGLLLAFLGLVIVVSERLGSGEHASMAGDFLCLVAGGFWAAGTLTMRATSLSRTHSEKVLLYQLVLSAPLLAGAAMLAGEPGIIGLTTPVIAWFTFTVVIVVFLSYAVWLWLLTIYRPSEASVFTFLAPVFAVLAGHLILDEPVTPRLLIALVLVAAGIGLVNRPVRRA